MTANAKGVTVNYESIKIDKPQYKAILFIINGEEIWLPRSKIVINSNTVTMPEWLAIRNNIIDEYGNKPVQNNKPQQEIPF